MQRAGTLGELKRSGHQVLPVREEMRRNLLAKLASVNGSCRASLASTTPSCRRSRMRFWPATIWCFSVKRGQAKSRIIRGLTALLDPATPVVQGCAINDNPLAPICRECTAVWPNWKTTCPSPGSHPMSGYGEKLATPDVSIADLIGEIDPIKVPRAATSPTSETIHYGIIPRTNRGIFAINELPD